MFTRLTGAASLAAAAALPLVLSACSSSDSETSMAQMPESLQQAVGGNLTARAAAEAATSVPRPGSVTQSPNDADLVRVTNFDPANNSFTIENTAGWTIGTGNAQPLNADSEEDDGIWLVQQVDGGQRVVVAYPRAAEEDGGTDWLAAGIWAFIPDSSEEPGDYEFGAFADGNDPFEGNLEALTGTAEYEGQAVGVYYSFSANEGEAGPFTAAVALTANFGDAEALGSISGTVSNVETEGGSSIDATLALEPASIGDSDAGFFTGRTSMAFGGRDYAGRWGGQFFDNGATPTDLPASVAGTFGATTSNEAGGTGSLVGAFGAERSDEQ